jgi:hypothetical protein
MSNETTNYVRACARNWLGDAIADGNAWEHRSRQAAMHDKKLGELMHALSVAAAGVRDYIRARHEHDRPVEMTCIENPYTPGDAAE